MIYHTRIFTSTGIVLLLIVACILADSNGVQVPLDRTFKLRVIAKAPESGKKAEYKMVELPIADYRDSTNSFSIFLKDKNENQIYNEAGVDEIYVGQYGIDSLPSILHGVTTSKLDSGSMILKANKDFYLIDQVAENGQWVNLQQSDSTYNSHNLYMLDRLPNATFEYLNGGQGRFHDYLQKDKYIYIEIWGTWCPGCLKIIRELRNLHHQYTDELTIISLNYKDKPEAARQFVTLNSMEWTQGISTGELNKLFVQTGFPFGVLFDSEGRLVKLGIKSNEIPAIIEGENSSRQLEARL